MTIILEKPPIVASFLTTIKKLLSSESSRISVGYTLYNNMSALPEGNLVRLSLKMCDANIVTTSHIGNRM